MLPQALASTYERYKHNTATMTTWLATTASTLGFVLPNNDASTAAQVDSTTTTTATSGRLKGKARAEAKKKAAEVSAAPLPKDKPAYVLRVRDLVPMAKLIADNNMYMPSCIETALDAAISQRTRFRLWLATRKEDHDAESDASHEHFLSILKQVQLHLRPPHMSHTSPSSPPHKQTQGIKSTPITLTNRFTGLSVSEPSQQFVDAPNVVIPTLAKPSSQTSPKRRFEVEERVDIQLEAEFAFSLLLEDLNSIREHIGRIWKSFRTSDLDLMQASIATDTAIELARSMIEEVVPLVDQYGGFHRMVLWMHVASCYHSGIEMTCLDQQGMRRIVPNKVFDNATYHIADQTYFNAWDLLHGYLTHVKPGSGELTVFDDGGFDTFDPKRKQYELEYKDKKENNCCLFRALFTDLSAIVRGYPTFPVRDALLSALEIMDKTREPLFYAAFALQIYFDIANTLGPDLSNGFNTCMSQMDEIEEDIRANLAFHKKHKLDNPNDDNEQGLRRILKTIRILKTDHVGEISRKAKQDMHVALSPADVQGHRLLRRSPLISGLLLFFVRSMYRQQSFDVANRYQSIMFAQHMHHALSLYQQPQKQGKQKQQQKGGSHGSNKDDDHDFCSDEEKWPDMEIVHHVLQPESFYPGGVVPKSVDDCSRLFLLQMGASPTLCARNWRQTTKSLSKTLPRRLKPTAPILSLFEGRYVANNKTELITAEFVEKVIEKSNSETVTTPPTSCAVSGREKARSPSPNLTSEISSDISADWNDFAPNLITALALSMQAETLEFTFPFLRIHRECIELLHLVRDACEPILQSLFGTAGKNDSKGKTKKKSNHSTSKGSGSAKNNKNKGDMEEKRDLHYVMLMILMTASAAHENGVSDLRPMELAAEVMWKWLRGDDSGRSDESGGKRICKKYLDEKQVRALEGIVAKGWSD